MTRVRNSTLTVLLAILLAALLTVERPAEALAPGGVVLAPSAAAALGLGSASGATAAAAAGGVVLVAGTAVVAAGALALIGWGVVESGLWDWATGSGDPLEPSMSTSGYIEDDGATCPTMTHTDMTGGGYGCPGSSVASIGAVGPAPGGGTEVEIHGDALMTEPWPGKCVNVDFVKDNGDRVGGGCRRFGEDYATPYVMTTSLVVGDSASSTDFRWIAIWTEDEGKSAPSWHRFTSDLQEAEPLEDRQLVTEADCYDPVTDTTTTVSETSALYAPGAEPLTPGVVCPLGTHVSGLTVSRTIDGGDGTDDELLYDATPVVPLTGTQYDDCTDGSCSLVLERIREDGTTESCFDSAVLCVGWITDPARSERYRCMWGTHVMPLDDCEMFHSVDTEAETGTATEPDGSVDSDLGTTTDLPAGSPEPGTEPSGCSPWAWINPFSGGIAQGVACAIEWAAVPSSTVVQQEVEQLQTEVMTKVPFAYADLVAPVITALPATVEAGACAGNLWDLTPEDTRVGYDSVREVHGPGHLAVPCTPPTWWSPVRSLLVAMVVVGTAWGLWNIAGVAVGGPRDGDNEGG